MDLRNACFNIWLTKQERKGIRNEFKPVFTRFIGTSHTDEYDSILKTLYEKSKEYQDVSIVFDNEIPINGYLSQIISPQLNSIDINYIKEEDIIGLFQKQEHTSMYVNALNYVIQLANNKENFSNEYIKKNFVKKLIVWTFSYIKNTNIQLETPLNPKCIYYGDITRHEIYFLILLYLMTFDVLYINPQIDPQIWKDIDMNNLSKVVNEKYYMSIESLKTRCDRGIKINTIQSSTLTIEEGINEQFYNNGVYKPWQFRKGNTESLFYNSTVIDLITNWKEPAKVRNGFAVNGMTVSIPCFFQKIEGEYTNKQEYFELVKLCTTSPNTLLIKNNGDQLIPTNISRDEMLSLTFCLNSNGEFDFDKLSKQKFYKLNKYKTEIQKLIVYKINETLKDRFLFNIDFNKEDKLQFAMIIINMNELFIKLIDSFDFTSNIPKIVVFLENENSLSDEIAIMLGYFSKIGMDIVIFDPSGLYNPTQIINEDRMNIIRLDEVNYKRTYSSIMTKQSERENGGFLKKLFSGM